MRARLLGGLSPRQVALVTFLAAFVTVLGALALAYGLRRLNARKAAR